MHAPPRAAATLRPVVIGALLLGALFGVAPRAAAQQVVTLATTRNLDFGRFAAVGGGAITVSPAGARSKSGAVVLLNSPAVNSASFNVGKSTNGNSKLAIVITLPANNTVRLVSGANSMAVNNFTSSPTSIASIPNNGSVTLDVGATLSVAPAQPAGSYSGTFAVTVNYQ
ncbi:MAG: DUF4402 domain-containing protein [Massilia sp.]